MQKTCINQLKTQLRIPQQDEFTQLKTKKISTAIEMFIIH